MKYFLSIISIIISVQATSVYAESMSGGGYVLHGGIDVIVNQSQGGEYELNPSGNPVKGENSVGGTYTLQPTVYPYISQETASQGQAMSMAAGIFGGGPEITQTQATNTVSVATPRDVEVSSSAKASSSVHTKKTDNQEGSTGYKDYPSRSGGFGRGVQMVGDFIGTPKTISIIWIVIVAILIIVFRAWQNRKNPSKKV